MKSFDIPRRLYDEIFAQADAEYPLECCGLIGGRGGRADSRYPLSNQAPNPEREYFAAPEDLFSALRRMRVEGEQLLAIYHSHPRGPAYPSGTDLAYAFYPQVAYLIVALKPRSEMRAFQLFEGAATEIELSISSDENERRED
jgi:proteasome lid subunit RPN8/RPN11